MYRIFVIGDNSVVRMLDEGPWCEQDQAVEFGDVEVHGRWFVQTVVEPSDSPVPALSEPDDELGWLRVYYDGEHLGDTPVRIYADGRWEMCDGSYGLLEHAEELGLHNYQDIVHDIEAGAMKLFSKDRCAMYRYIGYVAVYVPGAEQSL